MKIPAEIEALKPKEYDWRTTPTFWIDWEERKRQWERYYEALNEWAKVPGCPF